MGNLLLDQLCATADYSVEEKRGKNFQLCATSDFSVEEKGVRISLLMENTSSLVLLVDMIRYFMS